MARSWDVSRLGKSFRGCLRSNAISSYEEFSIYSVEAGLDQVVDAALELIHYRVVESHFPNLSEGLVSCGRRNSHVKIKNWWFLWGKNSGSLYYS